MVSNQMKKNVNNKSIRALGYINEPKTNFYSQCLGNFTFYECSKVSQSFIMYVALPASDFFSQQKTFFKIVTGMKARSLVGCTQ